MSVDRHNEEYKYYAFISYNSCDTQWGKRLQRKLEHYRMPAALCSEHGWKRKPISPVFFAPTDIQPGDLSEELKKRLRASKNLIVICSPHSAQSEWVGKEIEYFHELGRDGNIHFFIVDGIPNSGDPATECFNPMVRKLGLTEILGANVHEKIYKWPYLNRERAYVQLVSKLLGVEFDSIWQRHKRRLAKLVILWFTVSLGVIAALLAVWISNQPVDVACSLKETSLHNENLPPLHDAVVSIMIDKETKTDTLTSLTDTGLFANIPHRYLGKEARIKATCEGWQPVDTTLLLSRDISIGMHRDPHTFGDITFLLWSSVSERSMSGIPVSIEGIEAVSDASGRVTLTIPLEKQRTSYTVTCAKTLEENTVTPPTNESTALILLE